MPSAIYDRDAVDDDVFDADGELLGIGACGRSLDGVRVEDGDVGVHAVAKDAAILESESLGGERGHFANCVGQCTRPRSC